MSLHATHMTPDRTEIEPDIEREARRLLAEIARAGLDARLIGGMAIRLLAGAALHPRFEREIQDLDFVVTKKHRRDTERLLVDAGYAPEPEFNALNGARRLLFLDRTHGRQIDVFVDRFEMCHVLPLTERLTHMPHTLPAAEVLMTKLQIVQLNAKDRGDIYAVLHTHEIAPRDEQAINVERVTALTAEDWGLQRTFELNLERLSSQLPEEPLDPESRDVIAGRIEALAAAIAAAPKSRRWKLRARVGERKRWYEEPEEVDRDHAG
jgi:hypothetical protein